MASVSVRPATEADAAEIARVQVQGWHEAYTGRMPQSVLDDLDVTQRTGVWARIIASGRSGVWVAESDDHTIGFASAGPSMDDDDVPGRLQLYAIYVLATHYGSGAGTALLDAAIGAEPASLWVLEDNPRARAFYAKHGFAPDGTAKEDLAWGAPIHEVRLTR
ncbi:GNAT family N-acetyltransferase [Microbacterium invictum]|uniref:Ribosomal protein S18 acetylase RimI-like enzyme n=1 Tax=Microbacterium invictum TaxID=515415 RepID=A0AA40VM88_9MICO|nr:MULTISPECIES: GNAT family N-acetyltransferase [Microbacterium]MBB4140174.1 ribosomal protein S18 acetylase RimI-like enzyme [Microbacterium invictum]